MTKHDVSIEFEDELFLSKVAPYPAEERARVKTSSMMAPIVIVLAGSAFFTAMSAPTAPPADPAVVMPRVSGIIDQVYVKDAQAVKAGQTLAHIDDRDYRLQLDRAKTQVTIAEAVIATKLADLEVQKSLVAGGKTIVADDEAERNGGTMPSVTDHTRIDRDRATLSTAISRIDGLKAELTLATDELALDQATLRQAELNLSYTNVTAFVDGVVANPTLYKGQFVQAGSQLMAVAPSRTTYVITPGRSGRVYSARNSYAVDLFEGTDPATPPTAHDSGLALYGRAHNTL
jgi:membrane fusion protein, multidrug efflux system